MPVIGTKDKLVRFSYANVWEARAMNPGDAPKFGVQVLVPKAYKDIIAQVEKMIKDAIAQGIQKGRINEAMVKNPQFRMPFRDGDEEAAMQSDGSKNHLRGHMFFNANAAEDRPPSVVDKFAQPIMRRDDFYSGCYGVIDVGCFAYKNKGMGVAFGLNSIMKREDGERMDGRQSAESAFAEMKDEYKDEQADDLK